MTTKHKIIEQIARKHLCLETLETRNNDALDFSDQGVWRIKAALEAAYLAGVQSLLHCRFEQRGILGESPEISCT